MLSIMLRRSLLRSLFCAERLYFIFMNTSYFTSAPSRGFLDLLWGAVETGIVPKGTDVERVRTYIGSSAVPNEEDCVGADYYGLSFVSAVQMLCDFSESRQLVFLECLYDELEVNLMDQRIFEVYSKNEYLPHTQGLENFISHHPAMLALMAQLSAEQQLSQAIELVPMEIERARNLVGEIVI